MAYLTAKTDIEESTGLVSTTAAGHMALHNDKAKAVNSLTDEMIDARNPELATPAETATSVPDLLGQLKEMLKNITGETNWFDSVAITLASAATNITSLLSDVAALIAKFPVVTADIDDEAITADKIETQEGWTEVTYQNSWVAYSASYQGFHYMKDSLGFVHLTGLVKDGSPVTSVMATLPVGYRPVLATLFPSVTSGNIFCRISITSGGAVSGTSPISASWVSLHGITFKAA